ncbi:unnamed protein product [Cochlearia groenlandica]
MVDENNRNLVAKPITEILQDGTRKEMEMKKRQTNRRALGVINQNLVCAKPYSCVVVNKRRGLSQEETKKLKPSVPSGNEFGDCIFIDEEEEEEEKEATLDQPMPMSLEEEPHIELNPMVHDKFDLMNETLYLTVNLIDRFLSKQAVVGKKFQLVGLVALLLACKYKEVYVPIVDDLVVISDKAYTRIDVLEMEKIMLSTLQFTIITCHHCSVHSSMFNLWLRQWNNTCEFHSHYSETQFLECCRKMVSLHKKAASDKLTGVALL